jgi:hypothetical protein
MWGNYSRPRILCQASPAPLLSRPARSHELAHGPAFNSAWASASPCHAMPYRRQGIAEAEERLPSCLQHRHGKAKPMPSLRLLQGKGVRPSQTSASPGRTGWGWGGGLDPASPFLRLFFQGATPLEDRLDEGIHSLAETSERRDRASGPCITSLFSVFFVLRRSCAP